LCKLARALGFALFCKLDGAVKATPDRHLKPFWRKNRDGLMKTMKPVKTARFFALKFDFQIL
jgi:hypothetical protein